jgi:hypothetical protein
VKRALLVLLALAAAPAPAGAADTVIAQPALSQVVSAHAGRIAWSEADGRLMTWFNGIASQVPVPVQEGGFDVDLGPGPDGHTVAVYSREDGLYLFDFVTGAERRLGRLSKAGVREQGPAISRTVVVFFRGTATRRGLYTGSLANGRIRRIPNVPAEVSAYDFQGRSLAYSSGRFSSGRSVDELYVHDVVSGKRHLVDRVSSGALSSARFAGPAFAGSTLYAVKTRRGAQGNRFLRIDLRTGKVQEARGRQNVVEASFTGGRAVYLRAGSGEEGACDPCTLQLTPKLAFG